MHEKKSNIYIEKTKKIKQNKISKRGLKKINIRKICLLILLMIFGIFLKLNNKKIKIGVVGLKHHKNIGNNLLKFAISTKLKELGVQPYIIGIHGFRGVKQSISFINRTTNLRIVKDFKEIKKTDYDILMVNSDQTWRNLGYFFYDIAFLKFAENWTIPKFVYGASIALEKWNFTEKTNKIAKKLLKNFTGISVREISTVNLVKKNLGFDALFVLDPTLLIDKNYYINIVKKYKNTEINIKENFILTYKMYYKDKLNSFINKAKR